MKDLESTFIYDELKKNLLKDIKTCFIQKNINKELDVLSKKLNEEYETMEKVQKQINNILTIKSKTTKKKVKKPTKKNGKSVEEKNQTVNQETNKDLVKLLVLSINSL